MTATCPWGFRICSGDEPCYLCMKAQRDAALARGRELELLLFDIDLGVKAIFIGTDIPNRIKQAIGGGGTYTQVCRCGAKLTPEGHACGYWHGSSGGHPG